MAKGTRTNSPKLTYRLRDGRVLQAVLEDYSGSRTPMTFIKCGDDYMQLSELQALVFYDEKLEQWLKQFD